MRQDRGECNESTEANYPEEDANAQEDNQDEKGMGPETSRREISNDHVLVSFG